MDGLHHQVGAVVERHQLDAWRQRLSDLRQLFLHRVDDVPPACALEHEDDPSHGFAFSVGGDRSLSQFRANDHIRHVAHIDRHMLLGRHNNVFDVLRVLHLTQTAHDELLGFVVDEISAGVGVVLFQRFENLLQSNAVGGQPVGFDEHLVLLHQAAE